MLFSGEHIGDGSRGAQVDIAVDPLDGTSTVAQVWSLATRRLAGS